MSSSTAARATAWSATDVVARQLLQFLVGIALARLLEPSAFGTIAIIMSVTNIAGVLVDGGFSAALVQRQGHSRIDESTVFWFNLIVASFFATTLILCAPIIERALDLQGLAAPLAVSATVLVISSASAVPLTLMTKAMNFRTQAMIGFAAFLASAPVAIYMAREGLGVWALVWQSIISTTVTTVAIWCTSAWRPRFTFSVSALKSMFRFGGYMLATVGVDTVGSRAPSLILGAAVGPTGLGFFSRAESTAALPASLAQRIVPRVAFSAYSAISHDLGAIRDKAVPALQAVAFVTTPALLGLSALAEPTVLTLFGEKWQQSVPLLAVIALAALGIPFQVVNLSALMATGQSGRFFWLHLVKKVILVGAVLTTIPFGLTVMAIAFTCSTLIGGVADMSVAGRWLGFGFRAQTRAFLPGLIAGGIMWGILRLFITVADLPQQALLLLGVPLGAVVYLGAYLILGAPIPTAFFPVLRWLRLAR